LISLLVVTVFEVFCQTPKNGDNFNLPTPYGLKCTKLQRSPRLPRKAISFRKEERGRSKPLTIALPLDHAGVSAFIPPVIGYMAG